MTGSALVALLVLAGVVIVTNLVAYAIVRGAVKSDSRWFGRFHEVLRRGLSSGEVGREALHREVENLGRRHGEGPRSD